MIERLTDRSRKHAVFAIAGTWLAFSLALLLAVAQPPNPVQVAAGAAAGGVLIVLGFQAAWQCRPIPARTNGQRVKLAALSLLARAALGAVLVALLVMAAR